MALTKVTGQGLETLSDGVTITTADNTDQLTLTSTDADGNSGPNLRLYRNSSSPADDDFLGTIDFEGRNDNSQDFVAARIFTFAPDVSDGSEDAQLQLSMMKGGSSHIALEIKPDEFIINNGSVDMDFRVESDGNANMLFVDAGNNKVGIGAVPNATFGSLLYTQGTPAANKPIISGYSQGNSNTAGFALFNDAGNRGIWTSSSDLVFTATYEANSTEHMRLNSAGNLTNAGTILSTGTIGGLGSYNNTTGSSANAHLLSSGVIVRSTSSRRYKNTIEDATHGLKEVLTLRPVTYKGNNDGDTLYGGLIAEEVHDAGLTEFVTYNDKKEPDALAYGHMVSLCVKAIQELSAKNDALEASIAELKGNK